MNGGGKGREGRFAKKEKPVWKVYGRRGLLGSIDGEKEEEEEVEDGVVVEVAPVVVVEGVDVEVVVVRTDGSSVDDEASAAAVKPKVLALREVEKERTIGSVVDGEVC